MAEAVQWSPGEVDVWTRAFAEDHAQRAGLSVRDWLEQFVARETALAGPDALAADPPRTQPPEDDVPPKPRDEPATAADQLEPDTPVTAWAPPRDAFGQRTERPEPQPPPDGAPANAVAGEAAPATVGAFGEGEDDSIEGHFTARARVAGLWDLAEPRRQLDDEDIELLLGGPVAPVAPPAAARLDEVEVALRQVREEVQAAAPHAAARAAAAPRPVAAPDGPALGQASADAIAQLGVDIARLVDVVDCGFERLEAAGAQQAVDLRSDVAQMLDELAGRLERADRPTVTAEADAVADAEPLPTVAWDELDAEPPPAVASDGSDAEPAPTVASDEPETEPPPTVASRDPDVRLPPTAPWDDPDADLFDEPADFASITHQGPFGRALARPDAGGDPDLAATADDHGAPETAWADRGGWSEATAADFERHVEAPNSRRRWIAMAAPSPIIPPRATRRPHRTRTGAFPGCPSGAAVCASAPDARGSADGAARPRIASQASR